MGAEDEGRFHGYRSDMLQHHGGHGAIILFGFIG